MGKASRKRADKRPGKWVRADVTGLPWSIEARLQVIDGRSRLVGLHIEMPEDVEVPLSSDALRTLPVREIIRAAQRNSPVEPDWDEVARPPGVALPVEHYKSIRAAYELAIDHGESPTRTIQDAWEVSRSTAQVWIRGARERGLIDPED